MIAPWLDLSEQLPLSQLEVVVSAGDRYEAAWKAGQRPVIESYLGEAVSEARPYLFRTLLELELELRQLCGEQASRSSYLDRFSEYAPIVDAVFEQQDDQPTRALELSQEAANDSLPSFNWFPGQTVNGYEIVKRLGQGGMGIVFKARQHSAGGRLVALKVVRPDLLGEPSPAVRRELLARFQTEVKAAASIDHEHIVPLYEAGEVDGLPYYAMRFVDGENLSQLVERCPLPAARAAELLEPVVRAVAHLHDRKLLHRDIKPRNLILDSGGRLLLTDFGLAKQLEALSVEATISNPMLGTPAYMSPEQARGSGRIGPATDIYSLGATLYEMLTGNAPFRGATPLEILRQVLDEEPVAPDRIKSGVDSGIARICMKCLRKEPDKRYADAVALADDLARYRAGDTPHARAPGSLYQARRWSKRRPALTALALALMVAIPTIALAFRWLESRTAAARTSDLIHSVLTAKTESLLNSVDQLKGQSLPTVQGLENTYATSAPESGEKLRSALALFRLQGHSSRPELVAYVEGRLDQLDPSMLAVVQVVLEPEKARLTPRFWTIVGDKEQSPGRRIRVACILANWDSNAAEWQERAGDVTACLLSSNPEEQKGWARLLQPVANSLKNPLLNNFRNLADPEKAGKAASVLSFQFARDAEFLIELAGQAEPYQLRYLAQAMLLDKAASLKAVQTALDHLAKQNVPDKENACKRKANLAALSLRMSWDAKQAAWLRCQMGTDNLLRSFLIHRLEAAGIAPESIIVAMKNEKNPSASIALLLSLGEYASDQLSKSDRDLCVESVRNQFSSNPNPGVHSASEWLLRRWGSGQDELDSLATEARQIHPSNKAAMDWYLAPNSHTMTAFRRPVEAVIGASGVDSNVGTAVPRHKVKLAPFAIATKETTAQQILALCPALQMSASDKPATNVDFTAAAIYCNRLSELAGIPKEEWCYQGPDRDGFVGLVKNASGKMGYRLPTEEEWEFACRAGNLDTWFFGDSRELLGKYAWSLENANRFVMPVGRLKPNDFGLFDMLGNAEEWCVVGDGTTNVKSQAIRGGGVTYIWFYLQTEKRVTAVPSKQGEHLGFRIARTLPASEN